jgi:hypothetical protein
VGRSVAGVPGHKPRELAHTRAPTRIGHVLASEVARLREHSGTDEKRAPIAEVVIDDRPVQSWRSPELRADRGQPSQRSE